MKDDPTTRGPADRRRINLQENYEVSYWAEKFRCTRTQLEQAVRAAGVMADDVERHLKQQR